MRLLGEGAARIADADPVGAARTLLLSALGHMDNGDFVALEDAGALGR